MDELDIIIVNDGSKDETPAVAQKYCERYPESVRLINQENKGHGGALNTGCAAAVGKYLKVIDADDWIETQNLPEFVRLLKDCGSDVVLTHYFTRNISTGEAKEWKIAPAQFDMAVDFHEIMENWRQYEHGLTFHGITYRTDFYQRKSTPLSERVFYEDHEFAAMPCCWADSVMPVDLFVYDYRIGDVQQSVSDVNQLKRLSHMQKVLRRFMEEGNRFQAKDSAGWRYFCMKAKGVLLSYMTTVLLVDPDRKKGRQLAARMMQEFAGQMPEVYAMAVRQYRIFAMMNRLHIRKQSWEQILSSPLYKALRAKV